MSIEKQLMLAITPREIEVLTKALSVAIRSEVLQEEEIEEIQNLWKDFQAMDRKLKELARKE